MELYQSQAAALLSPKHDLVAKLPLGQAGRRELEFPGPEVSFTVNRVWPYRPSQADKDKPAPHVTSLQDIAVNKAPTWDIGSCR